MGVPGKIIKKISVEDIQALKSDKFPEPIAEAIRLVVEEQDKLKDRIKKLEELEKITKH